MLTSGIRRGLKYQSSKSPSTQGLFHPQEETHWILKGFVLFTETLEDVQHKMNSEMQSERNKVIFLNESF